MICSKCGAECGDNQAFCPKCGNPIQLMADFNLIEKELASSIDEFMNEIENEKENKQDTEKTEEFDGMKTIDVPLDEINMELKMVDISRNQTPFKPNISGMDEEDEDEDEDEDISPVYIPETGDNRRRKKNKKKMYSIIAGGIAAAVVLVLVIVFVIFNGSDNDKGKQKDFAYYYEEAENAYKAGSIDNALDMALKAVEHSKNSSDEKKARTLVADIYEKQNYFGEFYIRNLEELYYNGDSSEEYGKKLVECYMANQDISGFVKLYASIDEKTAKTYLGDKYVEKPTSNIDHSEYKNHVNIEMLADEGCKIYYIIGALQEATPAEYSDFIEIKETGEYKITAYAVSEEYAVSYPAVFNFTVVEGAAEGPEITPEGGTYYEPVKISVEVPQDGKAYYTCDGTTPDENATEYTEPFDMPRGISKIKVVVVDKYGNHSEVTSVQYNLKLPRNETVNSGKDKVWEHYYNNGIIDTDGNKADGSTIGISYYNAVLIENVEYYIYQVISTLEDSSETGMAYVAVNTYDGTVKDNVVQAGDEFVITETEE